VKDVPATVPEKSESEANAIYGVVMWRNIPSETDFFTVYMSGFSSAYRTMTGPDGEKIVARHTIQLDFWRPGDRFDQNEAEFRLPTDRFDEVGTKLRESDNRNPKWIFRPDDISTTGKNPRGSRKTPPPLPRKKNTASKRPPLPTGAKRRPAKAGKSGSPPPLPSNAKKRKKK